MQGIKPALIDESRGIGEQSRNRPVRRVPRISQAQPSRRPTPCGGLLSDVTAPARCSSKIARNWNATVPRRWRMWRRSHKVGW